MLMLLWVCFLAFVLNFVWYVWLIINKQKNNSGHIFNALFFIFWKFEIRKFKTLQLIYCFRLLRTYFGVQFHFSCFEFYAGKFDLSTQTLLRSTALMNCPVTGMIGGRNLTILKRGKIGAGQWSFGSPCNSTVYPR